MRYDGGDPLLLRVTRTFLPRLDTAAFVAVLLVYVGVTVFTLLTFPPFYEDESWTYLAVFESLRGNGFTWAAFGDGRPLLGVFLALVTPPAALFPSSPEVAIRIVSAAWGVLALCGAYTLARRITPPTAWVAPALMVATQYVYVATRYGRTDVVALALALWSLAAASRSRAPVAGLLFGLAVSVHPVFIWVVVPCIWWIGIRNRTGLLRFIAGAVVGATPQLLWMLLNRSDVQAIARRYAVSSSVAGDNAVGVLRSIASEPQRYVAYVIGQPLWQRVAQAIMFVVVPLAGVLLGNRRTGLITLALPAATGLALLAQNKNPYYLFTVLPLVAISAGCAVARFPRMLRGIVATSVAVLVAASALNYTRQAWTLHNGITAADATEALARGLPRSATVVTMNLYAGLIERRPDIQFFNFHALSERIGWQLPTCRDMGARIRTLVEHDPRPTSPRHAATAYVIAPSQSALAAYLRQIYVNSTVDDARCLLPPKDASTLRICPQSAAPCDSLMIVALPLPVNDEP